MIRGSDFGVRGGEEISSNSEFRTLFRDGFFGNSIICHKTGKEEKCFTILAGKGILPEIT